MLCKRSRASFDCFKCLGPAKWLSGLLPAFQERGGGVGWGMGWGSLGGSQVAQRELRSVKKTTAAALLSVCPCSLSCSLLGRSGHRVAAAFILPTGIPSVSESSEREWCYQESIQFWNLSSRNLIWGFKKYFMSVILMFSYWVLQLLLLLGS